MTTTGLDTFFELCAAGDLGGARAALDAAPNLARARHRGTTALHLAVGHPAMVRLLLERGADPNARDDGDHALPLHFAVGAGRVESVTALLDAGSDPQGTGDLHQLDTIGWAACFGEPHREVIAVLLARGATHHLFSAIALGDLALLDSVVTGAPTEIHRRLSRFEQEQSCLHYVIAPPDGLVGGTFRTGNHYLTLDRLIELGADLEARDARGRTPLDVAMLRGDWEAMRRLHAAGAKPPPIAGDDRPPESPGRGSVSALTPMLAVPDVAATVRWYEALGFRLAGSHGANGILDWASVVLGSTEVMLVPCGDPLRQPARGVSLWIRTDQIERWYGFIKGRQLEYAAALLQGERPTRPGFPFVLDLHTAFYGQREFGIRDPNGIEVMFAQAIDEHREPAGA